MQIRIRVPRQHWSNSRDAGAKIAENEGNRQSISPAKPVSGGGAAFRVALGILISRITGLIRESVVAHYFGDSAVADAFRAAIRIPNLLSNLFGEGVLSASFVTVYSRLRAEDRHEEAERLAGAVFSILALICGAVVAAGVALTPLLIDVIAPGFHGDKRELTIRMVRILFPGAGLLAMSAWCLGILNSHRRFLLSYTAPVALNLTMIAALLWFGTYASQDALAIYAAWASVVGSGLTFLVQLPRVLQLVPHFRPLIDFASEQARLVIRNFGPIFLSRGVVQISAYIDSIIASLLPSGAVAALGYGQIISVLPISLFSMSVSAAELPALSSAIGTEDEVAAHLRKRLGAGLRRIAFFVVPSAVAFLILGDVVAGGLYQTGRFNRSATVYVWAVLAGSAVGLLATSLGRLYSSAFYALYDTKTPLRCAVIRVTLTTALGFVCSLWVPRALGIDLKWGIAGLTVSAGVAGWVEFVLLRRYLALRIGRASLPPEFLAKLWTIALVAGGLGFVLKRALGTEHPRPLAVIVLGLYSLVYIVGTYFWRIEESRNALVTLARRLRFP
ncbi:MAG: murein biosynthesis integral membrane protein MurJ [Bryobacteraceae bacterium]